MNTAAWSLSDNFSGLSVATELTDAVDAALIYAAERTPETWPRSELDRYHALPRGRRDDEDEDWDEEDEDYDDDEDYDEDEDWDDEDEEDEDEDWDEDEDYDEDYDEDEDWDDEEA